MKSQRTIVGLLSVGLLLVLAVGLSQAQGPEPPGGGAQPQGEVGIQALLGTAFTYQGQLKKDGAPVNGTCDFLFSLWDDPTAGSQIGTNQEKLNVSVSNGLFTIPDLDFGADAFNGDARWLRIRVRCPAGSGDYTVLDPRQPLTAAPYALGLRPGARVVGTSGTILTLSGGSTGLNASGTDYGVYGQSNSPTGNGVFGLASATSGINKGVYGRSVSTQGVGVYGHAATTTGTTYGVYGHNESTSGRGVQGLATATTGITYGVYGESRSTSGIGVHGRASASTGTTYGMYGVSNSTDGHGVYGIASATSGTTYGVYGQSDSTAGRGVYGYASATSGVTRGVYGRSDSTGGYGVHGYASATTGTTTGVYGLSDSTSGRGVYGLATATSGTTFGVYGSVSSPNGWAGYFWTSAGNGVYISVASGKTGLNVASGTKNAVVCTRDGSRLLYTEESTEVWFTDYGFGKLQNGIAVVRIDPVFAQTVNLEEPYHVFVQVYGNAEVYVTNRTPTQFEVRLRDGDPNVEFSYRIVAKRLGYEDQRLERAPWADNDPNLYPEKRATWELGIQGGAP